MNTTVKQLMPRARFRFTRVVASLAIVMTGAAIGSTLFVAQPASAATTFTCPGGSFNLCIPNQGANEAVTASPGQSVWAGYSFTIPGSSQPTRVAVFGAYQRLTVTCANSSVTPTQRFIDVPIPDATYTAPFTGAAGWVPDGNEGDAASYQGSVAMPDLCSGGVMDIGQPGNMLFAAQVYSDGTQPISFRSHYNDASRSLAGSWSGTSAVTPDPIADASSDPFLGHWVMEGSGAILIFGMGIGAVTVRRRRHASVVD